MHPPPPVRINNIIQVAQMYAGQNGPVAAAALWPIGGKSGRRPMRCLMGAFVFYDHWQFQQAYPAYAAPFAVFVEGAMWEMIGVFLMSVVILWIASALADWVQP